MRSDPVPTPAARLFDEYLPSTRRGVWASLLAAALAGMMVVALVVGTDERLQREEREARAQAARQAQSLANSYATQLVHLAEQIDQVTRSMAFAWEDHPERIDLQRDRERGLLPQRHDFLVFIADADGRLVESSMPLAREFNFSRMDFFRRQRDACCDGILVSPVVISPLTGRPVVRFSRRVEAPQGQFGGVVFVSVSPDFLATFQDEALQGSNDFVSVRLDSGPVLATRLGRGSAEKRIFYKTDPSFAGTGGILREPAGKFRDARARYVAWRKIPGYPLVAVAGVTEEDALAGYRAMARETRVNAATVVLLLALLTGAGIVLSSKLAARRHAEEEVRMTYRLATEAANEGFYMLRPLSRHGQLVDVQVEDCNERAAWLLNMPRERLLGARASEMMVRGQRVDLIALCRKAIAHGQFEDEFRVPTGWMRASWVFGRAVHFGSGIALTMRDISDAKAHEQALSDLANIDALTRLPNRHWLMNFLPRAVERAAAGSQPLAVLFIDLDNFKTVNDTLGHEAGDELLQQAAQRIRRAVRSSDHVARLGGDEFTVVLEQFDEDADVAQVAGTMVKTLGKPFSLRAGGGNLVNASIGISMFPRDGRDPELLLKHADVAMYAAKAAGKGRFEFYHPELSDALLLRLSRERALRLAVEQGDFVVHYQPRVDARSGRLNSFEALIRWRHPERGVVAPAEFIDLAEDTGLVVPIGDWVMRQVVAQLAAWTADGERPVPVSVNVSALQLRHGQLASSFLQALRELEVDPSLLEVEVTESAVVDRSATVAQELDTLRDGGIRLMIDDFGVGHSSLAQLHRLDVDVLKVDRGFTTALSDGGDHGGSEGELLYRAIISMARALDMKVVAEGVETLAQLRLLRAMGCDELQGYLISRPLPAEDVPPLLRQAVLPPFDRMERLEVV